MCFPDFLKIIYLVLISSSAYGAKLLPQRSLSSAFELVKTQKKIKWEGFNLRTVSSETKCGLICSRSRICRAFTVCNSTICTLYGNDVFSIKKGYGILEDHANCNYYGMKQNTAPFCRTDGIVVDIQNNSESAPCSIHKKRFDARWTQWTEAETVIDSAAEFKEVKRRSVAQQEAHGGIPGKPRLQIRVPLKLITKMNAFYREFSRLQTFPFTD